MDKIGEILDAFNKVTAPNSSTHNVWIKGYEGAKENRHHFLVFLKPEATFTAEGVNVEKTLKTCVELLTNGLDGRKVHVGGIRVIGGPYLDKANIMVEHYGVIAKISKYGESEISDSARQVLKTKFATELESGVPVLGAHQFLNKYPQFNAFSLLALNDNLEITRLGPGTYAIKIKVMGSLHIVLNSFHPYQVVPYNSPGRAIIVFECSTDPSFSWENLRSNLAGPTDPTTAPIGSIRRAFLDHKDELGLKAVDRGSNCVHMSAGPLEGMVELQRFFTDHTSGKHISFSETAFGALLVSKGLSEERIKDLAGNPNSEINGKKASVFDHTEEKDASEAAELLAHNK